MKLIENIGKFLIKLFSSLGKFILFILFFFKYLFKPKFYLKNNLSYFVNIFISSIGPISATSSYTSFKSISHVLTADCAPIFLFDPKMKIIAAIHAGWKGAYKKIVYKTVDDLD